MKQLFTFVLAAMAFVACTQNDVEELSANRADVPETLTVGFEGGDTRIELNEALKTVWTEGDEVSVFYQSYDNTRWAFQGTTGDRSGELKLVSGEITEQTMDNIIVAYPYDANYRIDIEDKALHASLPAVQSYKEGSYGAEGNIMVAESDYRQFILKSVVGWLRVELTGEGESVKSITLRGNAGEQVAGDILVNAADASCILASEGAAAEDNSEVAGNLMLEESILTEITLNCGSGVELGSEAKSFYIGLLPQTFEQGITVEVECGNGTSTTKSTADKLVVERNHIVPMASFKYDGVLPEVYELAYTTNDGRALDPYTTEGFGGEFMENIYDAATGRGVLKFAGAITTIPEQAFAICENLTWIDIPEGITTIGASAFTGCTALEELTIPSTLTSLGSEAFQHCSFKATINCDNVSFFQGVGLTEVIIGDNVTTIGDSAFYKCNSLTSVTIPDSVTRIGLLAFYYGKSLTSVHITDIAAWCNISFGDQPLGYGADLYLNNELVTELTIPDSVTTIGDYAFCDCRSLTSVTIPDSVTTIAYCAFYNCYSLTSVTIGDSVTTIGSSAFSDCSSLTSVTIPDSVTTIGGSAFSGCTSLTSFYCEATTPPAGGAGMFYDTSATIYVPEGSLREYKMAENWSEYADYIVGYDFESGDPVTEKRVTVKEFLEAAATETDYYILSGTITSVNNTTYGNFDLMDDTGTVYIYGLCSPEGENKYWAESGAKVGDDITIKTIRASYNGSPQGKNAIFIDLVSPGTRAFWSFDKTSVTISADGGSQSVTVTGGNWESEVNVASDNAQFAASYADGVVTITAKANTTTEKISGIVTVACGALKQEISVTQPSNSAEVEAFVITFPGTPSEYVHSYMSSFTITLREMYTFAFTSFNNSYESDAWTAVRMGRKSDPSVATIATEFAVPYAVKSVDVNFTQVRENFAFNEAKLVVATDSEFSNVVEEVEVVPATVGKVSYAVTNPAANYYYKLMYDMPATGDSNGVFRIDSVTFAK